MLLRNTFKFVGYDRIQLQINASDRKLLFNEQYVKVNVKCKPFHISFSFHLFNSGNGKSNGEGLN